MVCQKLRAIHRQVQKLDRINLDPLSGSDQLGSTWIISDHKKKLNKFETLTHLKVEWYKYKHFYVLFFFKSVLCNLNCNTKTKGDCIQYLPTGWTP